MLILGVGNDYLLAFAFKKYLKHHRRIKSIFMYLQLMNFIWALYVTSV